MQKAAAINCLGGEKISEELKNLEIQFGELVEARADSDGKLTRRAGFGTKDKIKPLLKGGLMELLRMWCMHNFYENMPGAWIIDL